MKMRIIFPLLSLLCCTAYAHHSAIVRFNSRGIKGYITFTSEGNGNVRIVTNLQGLRGPHPWHVHLSPVDQSLDPSVQCDLQRLGGPYDPYNRSADPAYMSNCITQQNRSLCAAGDLASKFGPLTMGEQINVVDTTGQLTLSGRYSIVGRAVIIHQTFSNPIPIECGTIRLNEEIEGAQVMLLQATFISPIAGTIYMRQVERQNVEIFGKLYWVNDSVSTVQHNWHIHEGQPGEEYRIANCDITVGGNVGPHYDPTSNGPTSRAGYSTDCTPDTPSDCEVGDLSGKHARIDIPARPDPFITGAFFFTDSVLNLADVVNRSIVVHVPNGGANAMACAPLVANENYTLTAAGAQARFIQASQSGPFEDTIINGFGVVGEELIPLSTSNLTLLSPAFGPGQTTCEREDVYSPYNVYTGEGVLTPDRYDLGDWMNRYGSNLTAFNTFNVLDMPIYGANSMAGRTMRSVLTSNSRICSSWIPVLAGSGLLFARADFTGSNFGPIEGSIYFFQRDYGNGVRGNTLVVVDIYYSYSAMNTSGHNWHVHQTPPVNGMTCVDSIGGHYNPFSVSLETLGGDGNAMNSDYSVDCSPTYPLRCESGDLSGKHGQLSISMDGPEFYPTYAFLDPDLQLDGEYSIVGRSIGLHNFTGPLFDCAPVNRFALSTDVLAVTVNAGAYTRTQLAHELVTGTTLRPSDIFIGGGQFVSPLEDGSLTECVSFNLRILGDTQNEADSNLAALTTNAQKLRCSDAKALVVSIMLLVLCLLVALFH